MSKPKVVTHLSCPHCKAVLLTLATMPTTGIRWKMSCPNIECRRRVTVLNNPSAIEDGAWRISVVSTRQDRERDKVRNEYSVVDLDGLETTAIRAILGSWEEAADDLQRSTDAHLDMIRQYYHKRCRKDASEFTARRKVAAEVAKTESRLSSKTPKRRDTDSGSLDDQALTFRAQLLHMLNRKLSKGKITAERAAELVARSNLQKGLNELARELGIEEWF